MFLTLNLPNNELCSMTILFLSILLLIVAWFMLEV